MARDQTIFSEICVALSIVDSEDDFSLIKNLTPKDEDIYIKELKKRTQSKKSTLSIKSLQQSGKLIRNFLLKNGVHQEILLGRVRIILQALFLLQKILKY